MSGRLICLQVEIKAVGCADEGQAESKEATSLDISLPQPQGLSGSTDDAHRIGTGSGSAAVADDPIELNRIPI